MKKQINKAITALVVQKMKKNIGKCFLHYLILICYVAAMYACMIANVPHLLPIFGATLGFFSAFLPMFFYIDIIRNPARKSFDNMIELPILLMLFISTMIFFSSYLATLLLPMDLFISIQNDSSFVDSVSVYNVGSLLLGVVVFSFMPVSLIHICISSITIIDSKVNERELQLCGFSVMLDVVLIGAIGFIIVSLIVGYPFVGMTVFGLVPAVAGCYAYVNGFRPKSEEKCEARAGSTCELPA
ncbi:hypothetical protein OTK49_01550 [Vibrio coralliirubri]|uniref:hypothetical protein n=1 Tax=Vibrio coralliirubri TaxID=1516159 RepID=UPI0022833718|nr:hypothetical protein [Vibrio coralliirubri]MCY9861210.1 hypothetical protein [Vibrio coralliirubri]